MSILHVRAVFFDVDGVLLDSLPQHLRFCADKAREYGLTDLTIPSVEEFKRTVRAGVPVSPMVNFFLALGFPLPLAQRGVADYKNEFAAGYRPRLFPGTDSMLKRLVHARLMLGLVSSNTRENVEAALTDSMGWFDKRCVYYEANGGGPAGKAQYL